MAKKGKKRAVQKSENLKRSFFISKSYFDDKNKNNGHQL